MKAKEAIKVIRKDMEELNQLHLTWRRTKGKNGLQCLNYDTFLKKYNRTDEQILQDAINNGVYIEDIQEFLNNKK